MEVRGSTLALKPRTDITRSPKQGYQWPTKALMSSKNLKNCVLLSKREAHRPPRANDNSDDGNTKNTGIYGTKNVSFSDLFSGSLSG